MTLLTARENVKSISFDIWQHKYLLAFKPCENCYSLHDNMANTNSIVVAAIDSEYFAIIFAKRDRCLARMETVVVAAIFKSESPIRGLPNDCHVTEKGANFLLNTEKSRNNQAKVPNGTPFFTCIFEPPIKESSQKLTMNKYSHKKQQYLRWFRWTRTCKRWMLMSRDR